MDGRAAVGGFVTPMTDAEVRGWLSPEEQAAFDACLAATPGPWRAGIEHGGLGGAAPAVVDATGRFVAGFRIGDDRRDADFCATARTALPAALRSLAETRRALAGIARHWCCCATYASCLLCYAEDQRPCVPPCLLATMPRPET
jgi:hypothetical protein